MKHLLIKNIFKKIHAIYNLRYKIKLKYKVFIEKKYLY